MLTKKVQRRAKKREEEEDMWQLWVLRHRLFYSSQPKRLMLAVGREEDRTWKDREEEIFLISNQCETYLNINYGWTTSEQYGL